MSVINSFKRITGFGAVALLLFLLLAFFETNVLLRYFNWFTLVLVATYTAFTSYVFYKNNSLSGLVKILFAFLIYLPLVVHGAALIDPIILDRSWPLIIGILVFQSGLNILTLLGFFSQPVEKRTVELIAGLATLIVLLPIIVIFLLNIADEVFYLFMIPSTALLFVIVLLTILSKKASGSALTNLERE
jgi:hypothetical protein